MKPLHVTLDDTPLEVRKAELDLRRRVACLGLNQVRWLHANVPDFTKMKAELGQWRTRVMLDRYRRRMWEAQRTVRQAGMDHLADQWHDFQTGRP